MEEKKINLDTELRDVYDQFTVRSRNILETMRVDMDDTTSPIRTMRDLCQWKRKDLSIWRFVGPKTVAELINFLEKYGLRLGMSQRELAEYEGKPYMPQVSQKISSIDWEERTWQLARDIFSWSYRYDMDDIKTAETMADNATRVAHVFMEHYKKFFNNLDN